MNKLLLFLSIFCLLFFILSCQEEYPLPEVGQTETNQKFSEEAETTCEAYAQFKSKFCANIRQPYPHHGAIAAYKIVLPQGGTLSILPLKSETASIDFMVSSKNNNEYVISNTDYWYYKEFRSDINVPTSVKTMYWLNDLIKNGNVSFRDVEAKFEELATVSLHDNVAVLHFREEPIIDELLSGTIFSMSLTNYSKASTVKQYINNIGFASNETYEYIVEEALETCGYTNQHCADPICVFNSIFETINPDNFTDQEKVRLSFLTHSLELPPNVTTYLSDNPVLLERFYNFYISSITSVSCEASQIFCRLNDWLLTVQDDPLALLRDCMENDPNYAVYADDWINLATFNANNVPEVSNKLNDLGDEYWIQTLYNATNWDFGHEATAAVNMDFFGIRITQMPLNGLFEPMSPTEFLDNIRTDWANESVLGEGNSCYQFLPPLGGYFEYNIGYEAQEAALWLSNEPISTIFSIKMADDGSVIASDYASSCCWIFTTLNAPGWLESDSYDGYHPVSGNRRFGLRDNGDGSYTFFTQGVDRLTGVWHALPNATPFLDAFSQADGLWTCMLGQIETIVTDNGGEVDATYEIATYRPEWELLRQYLYENCGEPNEIFNFPCTNE